MEDGRNHQGRAELELSLQAFTGALQFCEANDSLADRRYQVLGNIGWVNRLLGRYSQALEILQQAVALADQVSGPPTPERIQILGELGTIYRQTDRHAQAKKAFEEQYTVAEKLGWTRSACRAIGNLGMANYQQALQLWEENPDDEVAKHKAKDLIRVAIDQLKQRVKLAQQIRKQESAKVHSHTPDTRVRQAAGWEAIGLTRLSLCYTALADMGDKQSTELAEDAAKAAAEAVELTDDWTNRNTVLPMSRFFYGRVLLRQGHGERALKQLDPVEKQYSFAEVTTPAMALCKEPSTEHRRYLDELVDAGADMERIDEDGYSALDYAVFSGDVEAEKIVVRGLTKKLGTSREANVNIEAQRAEARLRKGYREIFQEKIRPILREAKYKGDHTGTVRLLRRVYAEALAADPDKNRMFDHLKFIRYPDFLRFGRLPRSSDGVTQAFDLDQDDRQARSEYVIFFSYRWINQDRSLNTPDDPDHTQYNRMLDATELFLQAHPEVDSEKLCIWMDFACVDQDDPSSGVSALPIIIAQCDAVISLVDDTYWERAWCCVEAQMVYILKSGYSIHKWYEHVAKQDIEDGEFSSSSNDSLREIIGKPGPRSTPALIESKDAKWVLRGVKRDSYYMEMKDKKLSFERDRPKVMFLERQSKLLS